MLSLPLLHSQGLDFPSSQKQELRPALLPGNPYFWFPAQRFCDLNSLSMNTDAMRYQPPNAWFGLTFFFFKYNKIPAFLEYFYKYKNFGIKSNLLFGQRPQKINVTQSVFRKTFKYSSLKILMDVSLSSW